jgi:hypothetical protein
MSFINFNNKNKAQESKYSAEVIKEALYSAETKNTKKIDETLSSVEEPLNISEALKFFSDKINGLSALQEAKRNEAYSLRNVNTSYSFYGTIDRKKDENTTEEIFDRALKDLKKELDLSEEDAIEVLNTTMGRKAAELMLDNAQMSVVDALKDHYGKDLEKTINKVTKTNEDKVTISKEDMEKLHKEGKIKVNDTEVEFVDEAAKAGQWVGFITYSRGNKLEKTFKSHRAAVRWQNKNTDSILMQDGVKGMGIMSKDEWDQKEAPYAIKEDKLTWDGLLEKINEKTIVDVGRYLMAHDRKPKPNDFGTWMFSYDKDGDLENSFEVPKPMKWKDATKWAQNKAKKDNKDAVYVLESVNEKSINKIQKEWSKVTSEMKATVEEWKEAEGKEKEQLKTELKKLTAKKKELEAQLDSKVGLKDAGVELVGEARGQKIDADQAVEALEAEAEELADTEEEAAEALEYVAGRIDQTSSGKDITIEEIEDFLKDPRAKKYAKVLSRDVLEDIFKAAGIYEANLNQLNKEDYSDEMSYGQLERCIDYATMIRQRMDQGTSLDTWMHSQITVAENELNSVFSAIDGDDGVVEANRDYTAGRGRLKKIKKGSVVVPHAHEKYGEFVVDRVFKNKDGETSYTGKFKKSGEEREFILHSGDKLVKESLNEAKKMGRDDMMVWLEDYVDEARTSEEFDGTKGGIWISTDDVNQYKGNLVYNYYSKGDRKYEDGVLKNFEKELNKRGWSSSWQDDETVIIEAK